MLNDRDKLDIQAVLFDLDGTLLRAQMTEFIPRYVHALAAYCADRVKPKKFEKVLLAAIRDLIHTEGDGSTTNEERVYATMRRELKLPEEVLSDSLEHFRDNGLAELRGLIHPVPLAQKIVSSCAEKGLPLVLATNPVFPRFMIQARMAWAELHESDFIHVTSYENSYYCKPQSGYFQDIASRLAIPPEKCLMVGNDINHDLAAASVGMTAYLVDIWLVDRGGPEWPCVYRGDHSALQAFLAEHLS
ncbi:MAG: HAD family hydrolase [Desulfuromonadales bacterium]|nr:HAD family hydrolase [Desulfuromonadales bacterium]MBN2792196.1 HAD family hydrolase [Desulfuromonadales bacterium]